MIDLGYALSSSTLGKDLNIISGDTREMEAYHRKLLLFFTLIPKTNNSYDLACNCVEDLDLPDHGPNPKIDLIIPLDYWVNRGVPVNQAAVIAAKIMLASY